MGRVSYSNNEYKLVYSEESDFNMKVLFQFTDEVEANH